MNNPNEQSVGLLLTKNGKRKGVVCSDWLAEYAALEHKLTKWGKPSFDGVDTSDREKVIEEMERAKNQLNERFSEIISTLEHMIWQKKGPLLFR